MDIGLVLTIIGTAIGTITLVYAFLRNFKEDINGHLEKLDGKISKLDKRIDTLTNQVDDDMKSQTTRTDQANARLDQLYQMFVDLLKDRQGKTNP